MRSLVSALLGGVLLLASGLALANGCPSHMADIDARLAEKPVLSTEEAARVAELRAEGEARHKAGDHRESMRLLGEARKILGI
ncbi:hypothetical protein PU634_08605 [Oceanimonas pelagia]|uniref:Uncharacterized protein n=1 Tax=Oceanimonas pelagia TaxID=3028314 RepID=A0AA50Q6B7_9GAMM|nr:hypothetical protein [Oceanimonas pelagia]WMC09190.1 hypothetical protein PU634_08605 [Oceanimonas pelagia]